MRLHKWQQALGVLASLFLTSQASAAEPPVKIGFHAVLTGPNAVDGVNSQIAIKFVVDKWNKAGGIKGRQIELITYDDQAKPDVAVPIANRLAGDDKVVAVLSATLSEPTKAAAPFINDAKIPYISSWASSPDVTSIGDYVFRIGLLAPVEGKAGAKAIHDILKKRKVVLLTVKTDLGKEVSRGFREAAKKFDLDIANEFEYSVSDRQFGPIIANIKTLNPDVVFITGYYFNGTVVPQLRAAGVTAPLVGMTSFSAAQFLDIAGPAADGMLAVNVIDWSHPSPDLKAFLDDFRAKAGYTPTASAAHAYTGADVLFQAMAKTEAMTSEQIKQKLEAMEFDTIVGPLAFNSRHETKRIVYMSEINGGRYSTKAIIDDPVLLAPPEK